MGVLRALATIRVLLNNVLLFKFFPIFLQQNIFLCFEYDRNTDRHFATYGAALTADNPHLYLSIVTHFRSLRAGGFKFGPSLNKFGVGVSIGKQRSTISCFVEVLYNLSLHLDIAKESSSSSVSFFSCMVGLYWRSLITESSLEDLCSLNFSFILLHQTYHIILLTSMLLLAKVWTQIFSFDRLVFLQVSLEVFPGKWHHLDHRNH